MAYYKIKNITTFLPKRHQNKDTEIKVEYMVGFQKKIHILPVSKELVLSCRTLPIQIHNLRVKNLVSVIEISENEFMKLQKPSAKKAIDEEDKITTTQEPEKKKNYIKKKPKTSTIFLKPESE